jgi:hypothetical protein
MPQSIPTIVAVIVACPLPVAVRYVPVTVTMMAGECLGSLTEMSQVCELRLKAWMKSGVVGDPDSGAVTASTSRFRS